MTTIVDGTTGITFPSTSGGTSAVQQYSSKVLQVIQTVKTDTFSHSNGLTFTDVTGMTATITPASTSSKILVMWYCNLSPSGSTGTYASFSRVTRDGNVITQGDAGGTRTRTATASSATNYNYAANHSFQYLDSPASASTLTYKLQIAIEAGSSILCGGAWQGGVAYNAASPTTLILMEIAP